MVEATHGRSEERREMRKEKGEKKKEADGIRRDDVTIAFSRARVRALLRLGLDP